MYIRASLRRTFSSAFDRCRNQFWFDWQTAFFSSWRQDVEQQSCYDLPSLLGRIRSSHRRTHVEVLLAACCHELAPSDGDHASLDSHCAAEARWSIVAHDRWAGRWEAVGGVGGPPYPWLHCSPLRGSQNVFSCWGCRGTRPRWSFQTKWLG
jgi:hypothetical protein